MNAEPRQAMEENIRCMRESLATGCRESWARMIRRWRTPRADDAVWLTYSASYLFNTRGIRWAVDPVLPWNRIPGLPAGDIAGAFEGLSFVVLTHLHGDHLDTGLWREIEQLDCPWIVPGDMVGFVMENTSLSRDRILVADGSTEIAIDGIRLTAFPHDLHYARQTTGQRTGVPATGYLVQSAGGRYLLPGDIRTYDCDGLPSFPAPSVVFAHVFLGRSEALQAHPPLLDAFVRFYLEFRPRGILLAHLYEIARDLEEVWCDRHAELIRKAVEAADRTVRVFCPDWFEETRL